MSTLSNRGHAGRPPVGPTPGGWLLAPHLAIAAIVTFGCAQSKPSTQRSPGDASGTSATAPPATSPDQLLQDRLRAVASGSDPWLATLGPADAVMGPMPSASDAASLSTSGRLPPEVIQRIVRQNAARYRQCYERELEHQPGLRGTATTHFTIAADGSVSPGSTTTTGELPASLLACIQRAFGELRFPPPEGGLVTVTYPLQLSPEDETPSPPPPAPATPPPAPIPVPADTRFLIVAIDGAKVTIDGKEVDDLAPIVKGGQLLRVDGVFDALKAQREAWKTAHPGAAFPGLVGLRTPATTSGLAFKSVFQSIAFAGYPHIFVQSKEEPTHIVGVEAQVPGPPNLGPPAPRRRVLHLHAEPSGWKLTWKDGPDVVGERGGLASGPGLSSVLCEDWQIHSESGQEPRRTALVLHVDDAMPVGDVLAAAHGAESCTRHGHGGEGPVYFGTLSMR